MSAQKTKRKSKIKDVELHEDAWPRFEQFIRDIAKAGPQHKVVSKKPAVKRTKKAKHT